jgi:hypothetical protein
MWLEEHLWKFGVHLSNLVISMENVNSIYYMSVPEQQVHTVAGLCICSIQCHTGVPDLQGGLLEALKRCEISAMHVEHDGIKFQSCRVRWKLGAKIH